MPSARQAPHAGSLDGVTVDAFGTLVELESPLDGLGKQLATRGVIRSASAIERAFRAEASYYKPRSLEGSTPAGLLDLRLRCVRVFLEALDADLDPQSFVEAFVDAIRFRLIAGTTEALDALRAAGLELAVVANWDCDLPRILGGLGIADRFAYVTTSAVAGVAKPDPAIFSLTLLRIGVAAGRALHVGNEDVDRLGAERAGLGFLPAPLATVPERLGLQR